MNSRFINILLPLIFTCTTSLFAQNEKQVIGKIMDSTGSALQGISIKLLVQDSKDTLQTVSGKTGMFTFKVRTSKFIIVATGPEYISYIQEYRFNNAYSIFQLGDIMLYTDTKLLQSVEVSVSSIVLKEDTIEYKASLFKVKEDATVEDILKKLPGLEVNKNGTITAQGKPVYKIKVNGKDFFGNDVKMTTRELPANIIDKIQVIDDYGELAARSGIKTDEPEKIINLQLKKDKSNGMFGNAAAGYGSSDSYQAKLSTNFFSDKKQISVYGNSNNINNGFVISGKTNMPVNGMTAMGSTGTNPGPSITQNNSGVPEGITTSYAAGANYRFDFEHKNSLYGSYNFVHRNTAGAREQYLQSIYPSGNYFNNQYYDYVNTGNDQQFFLNLELYPDSMSYLKISPELFFNNNTNNNSTDFSILKNNLKLSEGYNRDSGKTNMPNFGISVLYNRYFHKPGRNLSLSLTANSIKSIMDSRSPGYTRFFDTQGGYHDSLQNQQINQKNKGYNYSVYLTYTEPVFKNRFIDLTLQYDFLKSANDRKVYLQDAVTTNFIFNGDLSNRYDNRFSSNRIGLNFRTVKNKYNYAIGINVVPVNTVIDSENKDSVTSHKTVINFSPLVRFSYTFSRSKNLSISYRGNNRQPNNKQLLPVRDISNQQFQREGNPSLKPEFSHTLNMSYNSFNIMSGSSLFSSVSFSTVQNKITYNSILLDSNGTQLTRPENINGFYSLSAYYSFSKPFQKNKYLIKYNGSFNINHDVMAVNNKTVSANNVYMLQGVEFKYNNNKWLEFSLGADYMLLANRNLLNTSSDYYSTWVFCNSVTMNLPNFFVITYDLEKIINNGLDASINKNVNLLNVRIEKKLFKKKSCYLSIAGNNILNQNFSLYRQVTGNSITDSRTVQLSRYLICTLTYKWNRF